MNNCRNNSALKLPCINHNNIIRINGYFFSKSNTYKELLQCIDDLKAIIPKVSELETKSLELLKTVLMPSYIV